MPRQRKWWGAALSHQEPKDASMLTDILTQTVILHIENLSYDCTKPPDNLERGFILIEVNTQISTLTALLTAQHNKVQTI